MAFVEKFDAGVQSVDQANQKRSASVRVSPADARLWFAAADHAARLATDVGLLLSALNDAQASDGTTAIYEYYVTGHDISDTVVKPDGDPEVFNSNGIKLTYATTNGGLPVTESIFIPQRAEGLPTNPDGKTYNIGASPFVNMETQLLATGLSSYGTAITDLLSATPNDI